MSIPTITVFMIEIRGYSRLYDDVQHYQWGEYMLLQSMPILYSEYNSWYMF